MRYNFRGLYLWYRAYIGQRIPGSAERPAAEHDNAAQAEGFFSGK